MIPSEIKNNIHCKEWRKLPYNEDNQIHATELWRRKPTDKDTAGDAPKGILPCYYGEWYDATEVAKAEWEVYKAEQEQDELERRLTKETMMFKRPVVLRKA